VTTKFALPVAAALLAVFASCEDGGNGSATVQTDDPTPPSRLVMDAHVPQPDGSLATFTVSTTSGDQSTTLTRLPAITFLAQAEDPESAISELKITGETRVVCEGPELGRQQDASWLQPAPVATDPQFTRTASLTVTLGRQNPGDRPGADFIAHCPPDMKLMTVSGQFASSATNGVGKALETGVFSFRWVRPP
jgi:hypothetical protein